VDERFCLQLETDTVRTFFSFRGFIVHLNIISFHISEGEM